MAGGCAVIFGATSGGGAALCKTLSESGFRVLAVARPVSDISKLAPLGIEIRTADAMKRTQVDSVFADAGPGAIVVSLLGGGPMDRKPVDGLGNINVIEGAEAARASRFVLVTAIGCGDSKKTTSFLTRLVLGRLMRAKTKAEDRLRSTKMNWTIVRPGILLKRRPTTHGILVENTKALGKITRVDLAQLIYRVINNNDTKGHVYTAVDTKWSKSIDDSDLIEIAV